MSPRKFFMSLFLLLFLSACSLRPQLPDPNTTGVAPFRPVTEAPPATATSLPTLLPRASAQPTCTDSLKFIDDLTIPDGTAVAPNSSLDKRWSVENSGTCNWDDRYHLRLTGGPDLGAGSVQALFPARAGSQAVIRIQMTAPTKPGPYRSAWQAYNPADEAFGDVIYIDILVK